jgi:hypothetical protein
MNTRVLTLAFLLALSASAALAQPRSLSPAQLDALFTDEPRIEVNVAGPLLGMVAELTRRDEPQFADMLRGLRGVYVRQYDLSTARAGLTGRVSEFARSLERDGWQTLVRVREPGENVFIYVLPSGNVLNGLVVMVLDENDNEATFVTIDGRIDPAQIGRLGRQFNVPHLDDTRAARR